MLPGMKAALNLHPMFVHFPIVLWLGALLFELLAVWRASDELQRTAIGCFIWARWRRSLR